MYSRGTTEYFNRQDVRDALHVNTSQPWELCTDRIKYTRGEKASRFHYKNLKEAGIRILHFTGTTDGAVPSLGTRRWIEEDNWTVEKEYSPFYITDDSDNSE